MHIYLNNIKGHITGRWIFKAQGRMYCMYVLYVCMYVEMGLQIQTAISIRNIVHCTVMNMDHATKEINQVYITPLKMDIYALLR